MMSLGLLVVALIAPTLAESTVLARGRFLEGAIALLVRALGLLGACSSSVSCSVPAWSMCSLQPAVVAGGGGVPAGCLGVAR